jgi:hypothetical protein
MELHAKLGPLQRLKAEDGPSKMLALYTAALCADQQQSIRRRAAVKQQQVVASVELHQ